MATPSLLVIDTKTGAPVRETTSREEQLAPAQVVMDPAREEFDAARGLVRLKNVDAQPDPLRAAFADLERRVITLETELATLRKATSSTR